MLLYNRMEDAPDRVNRRGNRRALQERETGEVMSFSADVTLPGEEPERGGTTAVYVADRFQHPRQEWSQPNKPLATRMEGDTEAPKLITREGIRLRTGVGVLLAALVLMMGIIAVSVGQVSVINRAVNNATEKANNLKAQSERLENDIADSASELNIRSAAAELGMVSARSADVIFLEVPKDAIYSNPGTGWLVMQEAAETR